MYSEKELMNTAEIIRKIAQAHKVPEAQVRADMMNALNSGKSNPLPEIQARWASFHYAGEEPTAEELILWITYLAMHRRPRSLHRKRSSSLFPMGGKQEANGGICS